MDIFILSDGKEIGPFSEETAQTLINQGTVSASDLAWASGMEDWAPLGEMLALREAGASEEPNQSDKSDLSDLSGAPSEAQPEPEPATAKQKAFLGYLAIDIPEDLSKEHASALLKDAVEDPAFAEKIGMWSAERLRLHPELFAAEIQARKENRANHFFDICQTEGAQFFTRITKAHCQVLVGFLDVKFPTWDSRMEDAATNYFFPAIAEKFPQLIERQWKDRFHYAAAPGIESAAPKPRERRRPITPLEAVLRGFALGGVVLAALYFGQRMIPRWMGRHSPEKASSERSSPSSTPPPGAASAKRPYLAEPSIPDSPAPKTKKDKTARKETLTEPGFAASPSTPPPAHDSKPANPTTATPSPEKPPSDPSMATPAPVASGISTPIPAPATPAAETPAPTAPPPTAAVPSKSDLVLTKPIELQLAYGKVKLPVGTAVKLVSRDGATLKVKYRDSVIVVPASSTDIDSATPESGASSFSLPPASPSPDPRPPSS